MAFDVDEEILQDFLVEAGEILDQLNEQLVELENRPDDRDLLNTVFRGFHTIKGGGSFLNLTALVAVCHRAEDVFNTLRIGQRRVDAALMDAILPVLDILKGQFEQLRAREEPSAAPLSLLNLLETFATPQTVSPPKVEAAAPVEVDITDAEFEQLLDSVQSAQPAVARAAEADAEISEDEFDALLDKLHRAPASLSSTPPTVAPPGAVKASDDITDDEFENLLDQLHSKSNSPVLAAAKAPPVVAVAAPVPLQTVEQPKDTRLKLVEAKSEVAASQDDSHRTGFARGGEDSHRAEFAPAGDDKSGQKGKDTAAADTTVRVDTKRLDQIMNLVGELVLVRNRLSTLEGSRRDEEMVKVISNLDVVTADLQAAVMKTRMQPIKKVFGRFPRVVRDLARSLNKEVNLELHGEETDLDKNLVEALADPLVHLVRNAVDHGIEMPEVRERSGKSRTGTISLAARQEGDHILLTIEDDGGGMDPEVLRRKAVEKGVLLQDVAERLSDTECFNLIFLPGFSTKEKISDISGRGVGLDVVKTRIAQLNGVVEILSQRGKGTTLSIKVPLTLAIMPTLMVMLKNQTFALPLVNVSEILHLDLRLTNVIDGQLVIMVRERALPLFYLRHWLAQGAHGDVLPDMGHVVVVTVGAMKVGFIVDHLVGQEEVVIKPLGAMLQGTKGLSGATITGDGRIALILDVPELMRVYARRAA